MFGYITVNKKELKIKEWERYHAYYCGLCHSLKEVAGAKARMTVSYDMTFLAMLLDDLYDCEKKEGKRRCPVHPAKQQEYVMSEASRYSAKMNLLLCYDNLLDDWKDEKKYSKVYMANMISKYYLKFAEQYPRQAKAIESYMENLSIYERKKETNIDLVAGLTGEMLGEVFAWKEDEWYQELKTLGFYMGKYIYLMDAYEDIDKDEKKDNYNPLRSLKKDNPKDFETLTRLMMTSMMSECAKSFERLPILLHADILRNILYSGVWTKYEYIQLKKKKRTK